MAVYIADSGNILDYYGAADASGRKFHVGYGGVDETGDDYVIAHGVLSHTGESNWYNNYNSNGWLHKCLSQPVTLRGGKTYTLSFDETLLETVEGRTSFLAAVHGLTKSINYTLKNTLETQHFVFKYTLSEDYTFVNQAFQITLNSLKVKISNLMLVEGDVEQPYKPFRHMTKIRAIDVKQYKDEEVTEAYTSRTTAGGMDIVDHTKAAVTKIEGATVAGKNLIPFPYRNSSGSFWAAGHTFTQEGVTCSVGVDGSITTNGTANAADGSWIRIADYIPIQKGQTYRISGSPSGNSNKTYYVIAQLRDSGYNRVSVYNDYTNDGVFTVPANSAAIQVSIYIRIYLSFTVSNLVFKPMLIEGEEALPYMPYFPDLKHAYFQSIASKGRNLLNIKEGVYKQGGITFTRDDKGVVTVDGTLTTAMTAYVFKPSKPLEVGKTYTYNIDTNDTRVYGSVELKTKSHSWIKNITFSRVAEIGTFTVTEDMYTDGNYISFDVHVWSKTGDVIPNVVCKPMLNEGSTALPFEPYKEDIYQLPESIELGAYDSFNPQTGEITRATKKIVFTGEEDWSIAATNNSTNGAADYRNRLVVDSTLSGTTGAQVSNIYNSATETNTYYNAKGVSISAPTSSGKYSYMHIYDPDYNTSDISLWKAHLAELYAAGKPLIVEYELATPTIETIADIPKDYDAWSYGTEEVSQGETDNSIYGAIPTITTKYKKVVPLAEGTTVKRYIKLKESNK